MTSIGETLRRERLRRNLNLDQISRQTKIGVRLLEAIEREQFEKLPGGVFTRSFVRQYARALGLDEDEIAGELQRVLQPPAENSPAAGEPAEPSIRMPRVVQFEGAVTRLKPSSSLPAFALVVTVMLVCSAVYAWWQRSRRPAPVEPGVAAQLAADARRATAPPASSKTLEVAKAQPAPGAPGPVSASPTNTPPSPAQPAALPGPAVLGTPGGPVQVGLNANDVTWVKVWSDGKPVFEGTLHPNQTQAINASGKIRIRVGNAGGLDATLNGKPVGPLGRRGQISVVQFTPEGALVVPVEPFSEQGIGPIERGEPKAKPAPPQPKPEADLGPAAARPKPAAPAESIPAVAGGRGGGALCAGGAPPPGGGVQPPAVPAAGAA